MSKVVKFKDREIQVEAFTDIVGECETLEFREAGAYALDIAVTQRDDEPERLYVSINGEADIDYVAFAIAHAKKHFEYL